MKTKTHRKGFTINAVDHGQTTGNSGMYFLSKISISMTSQIFTLQSPHHC